LDNFSSGRYDEYVTDLYQALLGHAPDLGALTYSSGMPRSELLESFRFSAEFDGFVGAIAGNPSDRAEDYEVMDYYVGFMACLPDRGGFKDWLPQFRPAHCRAGAAPHV